MMLDKRIRIEGNVYSKFVQTMRSVGYSKPVDIGIATVLTGEPAVTIQMDHFDIILDGGDITVAHQLTEHERTMVIDGVTKTVTQKSLLQPGTRVIVAWLEEDMRLIVLDKAVWRP